MSRTDPAPHHTTQCRQTAHAPSRPRLAFVGVGWIGRHRLQSLVYDSLADAAAIIDPDQEACRAATAIAPDARVVDTFEQLFNLDLDGIVIATPSALHAPQVTAAVERGFPVFCQKPLARTEQETRDIVEAARRNDCLLGVDLSYRYVNGVQQIRDLIVEDQLGDVYAVDLTFHNAHGPDKAWFYEPHLAGGGCVIDLGVHLADLAMWVLGSTHFDCVHSRLYAQGRRMNNRAEHAVEDCAFAEWSLDHHASVRLACSWNLPAGRNAVIEATFYGTRAGATLRNIDGSFWDFTTEHLIGTDRHVLAEPPDEWSGRALADWTRRLTRSSRFDPDAEQLIPLASLLDAIYQR